MRPLRLTRLDPQTRELAERIHAVQMAAYRQEARLLGVRRFPPLETSIDDIQRSQDEFWGAFEADELLGVIGLERLSAHAALIASLTVAPAAQRRGIGRALVTEAVRCTEYETFLVSTGAKNAPGLAFYARMGFDAHGSRSVGEERLEIVELAAARSAIHAG